MYKSATHLECGEERRIERRERNDIEETRIGRSKLASCEVQVSFVLFFFGFQYLVWP